VESVEIALGGDSERNTLVEALRFAVSALSDATGQVTPLRRRFRGRLKQRVGAIRIVFAGKRRQNGLPSFPVRVRPAMTVDLPELGCRLRTGIGGESAG
jgi:hypothetical protein